MRVIVETIAGPSGSRRFVVSAGQVVKIGRTEAADISFPRDEAMSSQHFQIAVVSGGCFLTDLESSNGTCVNQAPAEPLEPVLLRGGEQIRAGQTQFSVHVEGVPSESADSMPAARPAFTADEIALLSPLVSQRRVRAGNIRFTVEVCDSGLTLCRGAVAALAAGDLAAHLSRTYPLSLIVDFRHLGSPPPPELTAPEHVFNWLDRAAAAAISPVLISQQDLPAWPAIVEEGWGNDAVVCLFAKMDKSKLLEHVRCCCRGKGNSAIAGYCWPSVLASLLSHSKDLAGRFMQGIEAVLMELPQEPETWQVYGDRQVALDLEGLGLFREGSQPVTVLMDGAPSSSSELRE